MDDWGSILTKVWNVLSGLAIVGTIIGWFPYVAAFAGFLFYIIQIWESATVQRYMHTRRLRAIAKLKVRMASLEAREKKLLAQQRAKIEVDFAKLYAAKDAPDDHA